MWLQDEGTRKVLLNVREEPDLIKLAQQNRKSPQITGGSILKPGAAYVVGNMAGERGFEPPTPWSRTRFRALVKSGEIEQF